MSAITLTALGVAIIIAVRNEVAFAARMKALDVIYDMPNHGFDAAYAIFKEKSYEAMMFDLTKWTFAQFYPSLARRSA